MHLQVSRSEGTQLSDMKAGRYPSLDLEEIHGLVEYFPVGHQHTPERVFWHGLFVKTV